MKTKEYNLSGFSRVSARFAMDIEIARADNFSVSITGGDAVVDHMEVSLQGDKLVLAYKLDLVSFFAIPFTRTVAKITLPDLSELDIVGAAHATVKGFNSGNDFSIVLSGASRIEFYDMAVGNVKWDLSGASRINGAFKATGNVDMRISGASRIDLKGSANDLEIDASGASRLELDDFQVHNAKVKLSGATNSAINVSGRLDVSLEGASKLEYGGQPTLGDVRVIGASSLRKK
jgi:hypothetical protein